jgi:hypothetical protein
MEMPMKAYLVLYNNVIAMTDNSMVILQNCLYSQKDVPGSHVEALASSSHDGVQGVNIKVEESSDIGVVEEEDPVPMRAVGIKVEHEVSSMSLCPP